MSDSIYEELGVKTVIHAGGTKSFYGGSRVSPEVLAAMCEASQAFVNMLDLNRKIGKYIAHVTGAEAGMVTNGAAGGIVLSAAACITGTDIAKIRRLPDTTGMKNELIVMRIHRGRYSHMYSFPGARLVEIGDINDGALPGELKAAINDRTAAITYLLGPGISKTGLTLAQTVKIAHDHHIPVIVDAAAMLPPKENLRKYIAEGADLVVFSGGKMIHGPQATGLLFGRSALVEAALANMNPNHAIGRPYKVSREDMVGLYVALKRYIESDEEQVIVNYRLRLQPIIAALQDIAGIRVTIEQDNFKYHVPTVVIHFLPDWSGANTEVIKKNLLEGDPAIFLQSDTNYGHLQVNPISLQKGEAAIVGTKLKEELLKEAHMSLNRAGR